MARGSLPPGFRFHPTDVELILYYLKRKILGKPLHIQAVTEVDLYKFAPWDLPAKSCLQGGDLEWYFYCARDKKYASGPRTNRATEVGYWKATGRDRTISNGTQVVGMKKTLIFHVGKARVGTRTNWVMHEYKLETKDWDHSSISQDSYVLCKIFEKSGAGPKNGEQRGVPFKEEEWEEDLVDGSLVASPAVVSGSPSNILEDKEDLVNGDSTLELGNTFDSSLQATCQNASPGSSGQFSSLLEAADINDLFAIFGDENEMFHSGNNSNEIPDEGHVDFPPPSNGSDIFKDLEDLDARANLEGNDNLHLPGTEDDFSWGHALLGDGLGYMELDDLNCPMTDPVMCNTPELVQYNNFRSRLEVDIGNQLDSIDRLFSGSKAFSRELNSLDLSEHPLLVNSGNVPFGSVEGSSIPFVASEAVQPTYGVESSRCILPRISADTFEKAA